MSSSSLPNVMKIKSNQCLFGVDYFSIIVALLTKLFCWFNFNVGLLTFSIIFCVPYTIGDISKNLIVHPMKMLKISSLIKCCMVNA